MRIALINPRFRLPIDTRTSPHLGLAYLGAVSQARAIRFASTMRMWRSSRCANLSPSSGPIS